MRCLFFALSTILAVTLPCQAQDAKPNTLTPKELADGWILLFDGETTIGWNTAPNAQQPKIVDGELRLAEKSRLTSTTVFAECELQFEYKLNNDRATVGMLDASKPAEPNTATVSYYQRLAPAAKWTAVTARLAVRYNKDLKPGRIWLELEEQAVMQVRNIKLKPLNTKSIFNGKDLTGWKEFPGKKSKFTVTDDGELNVKNGPGDLQTTGKYQNFILQLECIGHGKHLNSGIFFRCRDNEYQNGYEAQIRNQFTAEATQEYLIDIYDPMTNKLLEKKKIKSTAVDYGTGAIYRRQPARKEMAKDGDWFAMTIIAHGNHLATWVNGVQVTDWHDHRPVSDNARTGCKLEAGHISIQGHDPTTNLSFRNLRVVELPGGK